MNQAGKYRQGGPAARAWYQRLAREIDDACRAGELDCLPPRSSPLPPWRAAYLRPLLLAFQRAVPFLVSFDRVSPRPAAPRASEFDLRRYEVMTNERIPRTRVRMVGVVATPSPIVLAVVVDSARRQADAAVQSQDLMPAGANPAPGPALVRYDISTSCTSGCWLVFATGPESLLTVPISEDGGEQAGGIGAWRTEAFNREMLHEPGKPVPFRIAALEMLTRTYAFLTPLLVAVAALLIARRVWLAARARVVDDLLVVVIALGGAVLVRLLMLAMIDVAFCPAIVVLYCAPAYSLCLAACMLSVAPRSWSQGRSKPPT